MFDQVDRELTAWVSNAASIAEDQVALTPPGVGEYTVSLYLLHVVRVMTTHETPRNLPAPTKIMLHYLLTVQHANPLEAHRLLGDLMFAAIEEPEYEVDLEPLPLPAWTAFGQVPQPAFILKVPLRRERPEREVQLVRKPMQLQSAALATLHGVLLGPEDTPIHGAAVELPSLRLMQRTNRSGAFQFMTIPAGARQWQLIIRAKGRQFDREITRLGTAADPVIVRITFDD